MADEDTPSTEVTEKGEVSKEPFKKPVLIGRIGKLPKKVKTESEKAPSEPPERPQEPEETLTETSSKTSSPQVSTKELSAPVPYKEPKWSGLCPDGSDYGLEVLKSGMIMEQVDLTQQPYFVFGRLPNCDVVMAHPTISRHHCILQYKAFAEGDEPSSGWYLFDLGSTHGTYLNKDKLKVSHYTRVRVGHQIKFGNSTRTYILTGPDFDCEGESELTVTEIKQRAEQMKLERDRLIREAKEQREKEKVEEEKKREEQGIDWGMGEDAEDETDLSENPFAVTTNEELYLTDPKKTLRGYFEREGYELQYDCEERGQGQYLCKVELPLDDARGRPVMAEAIHTGKKKEAVVACALEACRILDRAGLLRQAKHESRRRKERDWSADDFYDSDDDNYLDRTGQVENKRRGRMQRHGALRSEQGALTYDQLIKQSSELESKIKAEERTLDRLRASIKTNKQTDTAADDLDQYMATLAAPSMSVKAEISTCKMTIQKLKGELSKTQRLAELARPAHLPPLVKNNDTKLVKLNNSVVYGKRIKLKTDTEKKLTPRQVTKQEEGEFVEEVDSDEEAESRSKQNDAEGTEDIKDNKQSDSKKSSNEVEDNSKSKMRQTDGVISKQDKTDKKHGNKDDKSEISENSNVPSIGHTESVKTKSKNLKSGSTDGKSDTKDGKSGTKEGKSGTTDGKSGTTDGKSGTIDGKSGKVYGPMRPPDDYVIPEDYFNQESDRDLPEIMEE